MTDARPDARPDRRCVRQNRCSHLIAESPTNAIGLERGRPLTLIPVPLSAADGDNLKKGRPIVETALALWSDVAELYSVGGGPLEARRRCSARTGDSVSCPRRSPKSFMGFWYVCSLPARGSRTPTIW